jgi:transposase
VYEEAFTMVLIGVDPHKASHTAVAIDGDERPIARLCVTADRRQVERLLAWAEPLDDQRTWAVESAGGLGRLLAQQLVAAGEYVVDVPATLAARVRLLGSSKASKNDPNDALSTAIAGLRHDGLRPVVADDHTAVLRLLADRHRDLVALRTQVACRLHVVLRELVAGGAPLRLRADRAASLLRRMHPATAVDVERKRLANDLLADMRRLDRDIVAVKDRIGEAVAASGTTLVKLHGVGPIVAAIILGQVRDQRRFPTRDRFAAYNGTAPIEASSGHGCGIGSTRAATGSSTTRRTSSPSPRSPTTPPAAPTSNASSPTGSRRRKRSGRLSAESATPSGANFRSISNVDDQRAREGKRDDSEASVTGSAP